MVPSLLPLLPGSRGDALHCRAVALGLDSHRLGRLSIAIWDLVVPLEVLAGGEVVGVVVSDAGRGCGGAVPLRETG